MKLGGETRPFPLCVTQTTGQTRLTLASPTRLAPFLTSPKP
jgi:hypothetical protein